VTTTVEHPSILDPLAARKNDEDTVLAVDRDGLVHMNVLEERLRRGPGRALVTIIATNNETGVEQNFGNLIDVAAKAEALLHFDATQAVGTTPFRLRKGGVAGVSISAHKIYGPKGVGALIATSALRKELTAVQRGGGHERGFRSGTLNVPGIVGFGVAARLLISHWSDRRSHLTNLRRHFLDELTASLGNAVTETVRTAAVSPHILSVRLRGANGRALIGAVRDDVAFSLGSACATNKAEPSHVLTALGLEKRAISETIRLSFSAEQSLPEIGQASQIVASAAQALSGYSMSA
jgi:cysteine desulfurase